MKKKKIFILSVSVCCAQNIQSHVMGATTKLTSYEEHVSQPKVTLTRSVVSCCRVAHGREPWSLEFPGGRAVSIFKF